MKKRLKTLLKAIIMIGVVSLAFLIFANAVMQSQARDKMYTLDTISVSQPADAVLVLGARVWSNGTLSYVLEDRMEYGVKLYLSGDAKKMLLSGDHGQDDYDEVNAMKQYALDAGVPAEDIFLDHAGFSTYDSMYRARDIFGCKNIIIVTQKFHMPRALYIANKMGINAIGVNADPRKYASALKMQLREYLACTKDYLTVNILKPLPKYLGDTIPISGSGLVTFD